MDLTWTPIALFPMMSFVALAIVTPVCLSLRKQPGALALLGLIFCGKIWAFGYAFELCATSLSTAIFWANFQYLGISFIAGFALLLALQYSGKQHYLNGKTYALMFFQGYTIFPLVMSDPWTHAYRKDPYLKDVGGFYVLMFERTPWVFLNMAVAYGLILTASTIFWQAYRKSTHLIRNQALVMFLALTVPMIFSVMFYTGWTPIPMLDLTPMSFSLTGLMLALALRKWSLFDLAPVARDRLVDQLPYPVFVADISGRVVDANRAAREVVRQFEKRVQSNIGLALEALGFQHSNSATVEQRYYQLERSAMHDLAGNQVGETIVLRDGTAQKEIEQNLKSARDMAEQASEAKSRFIANVSHEIRTPLSGVIGLARLLNETKLSAEQKEYVDAIQACSDSLMGVVNDILDHSKLSAGKATAKQENIHLRDELDKIARVYMALARQRGLQFHFHADPSVPQIILSDRDKLHQILHNLLGNALKFTPSGCIKLTAKKEENAIIILVSDTGIGIGPEHLKTIFSPFQQADSSRTRQAGGTGLGLAISYGLVQVMGGTLTAKSELGAGTTFQMQLPYVPGKVEEPTVVPPVPPGLRVLVAEDNPTNALVVGRQLKKWNAHTVVVGDGQAAVDAAEQMEFDIIFLDLQMPVMDGLEAASRIRARHPSRPIIALTANATDDVRDQCEAAGFSGFLAKPLEPVQLQRILATLTQSEPASRVAP